jgi:S1-C subfamily serine protease
LGMEIDEQRDFSVCEVVPQGPAQAAGVEFGDRLIEIDGKRLSGSEGYRAQLLGLVPNQKARFTFLRGSPAGTSGEPQRFEMTFAGWSKVDGVLHQHLGLTVEQTALGHHQRVKIETVAALGPAAALGLVPGDVIDSVRITGGDRSYFVDSPENFASMVAQLLPGVELTLDVLRDANQNGLFEPDEIFRGSLTLR